MARLNIRDHFKILDFDARFTSPLVGEVGRRPGEGYAEAYRYCLVPLTPSLRYGPLPQGER